MKRLSMILLGVLTLPAYGGIASQEYVDAQIDDVSETIESKADKSGYTPNMLLQTKDDGKLTATTLKTNMIENGAVTNSKLASNIGLDKLDMGTLPTSGKHILIWNSADSKYVFEELIKPATGLQCPAGQYDIGFSQCIDPGVFADGDVETERDRDAKTWSVTFGSGTINGVLSCNAISGDNNNFAWNNDSSNWLRPGNTFDQTTTGSNCWCKMTSPSESGWVYVINFDDDPSLCEYECPDVCGEAFGEIPAYGSAIFSSIGK